MSNFAVSAHGLTRYFGHRAVVENLDLGIPYGSVTGLLGLNGAGKTTALRMLLGLLTPTRGSSTLLGQDSQQLTEEDRNRIGYTVEGHFLYGWMTVRDIERFQRDTFRSWNGSLFESTVRRFGIDPSQKTKVLSRGQRAGVSIALTLATEPDLLILDDPALGLDPVSRLALNETILEFCDSGTRTVLLSSHFLDDVERVADRVIVMVHGRTVVNATVEDFRSRVSSWAVDEMPGAVAIETIPGLIHARPMSGKTILTIADFDQDTEAAIERICNGTPERLPMSFDEAVVAYLSRSRQSDSFFSRTGA